MIDARKFCAMPGQEIREWLTAPSIDDHFVYACDGARAIRVQRALYAAEANNFSEVKPGLVKNFQGVEAIAYIPLPEIIYPKTKPCRTCASTGLVDVCNDCYGTSTMICPHCDHEAICGECCDGAVLGNKHCCPTCYGIGRVAEDRTNEAVKLFDFYLHFAYVSALSKLPELQSAPTADPMEVVKFRFTGGHALVMPRRK